MICKWLEASLRVAKLDQVAADRRGFEARDEYDVAAAKEWVCLNLQTGDDVEDQARFAGKLKALLSQHEHGVSGVHNNQRFQRAVRAVLRKVARVTRTNEGFGNTLRHQR